MVAVGVLGAPGCFNGRPIRINDKAFNKPSCISFFSCGIWAARSLRAAVRAGLSPADNMDSNSSCTSLHIAGPMALANILMQVYTVASTTKFLCFLEFKN